MSIAEWLFYASAVLGVLGVVTLLSAGLMVVALAITGNWDDE